MNTKKKDEKEGISVKELETFAKKHRIEVFFCLSFILACFFSFAIWGSWWTIGGATVGGVLGVLRPVWVAGLSEKMFQFIFKQESTTQLVLGIVGLILSIFLSPLIFLVLGLHGGKDLHKVATDLNSRPSA